MVTLEDLTKEDLIKVIREKMPNLNELSIVEEVLNEKEKTLQNKGSDAYVRGWEYNSRMCDLIEPYALGPIEAGVKFKAIPKDIMAELKVLEKARNECFDEGKYYHDEAHKIYEKWKAIWADLMDEITRSNPWKNINCDNCIS